MLRPGRPCSGYPAAGEQFPWIDTDRVGIWGASGGGYATARALLEFGDFYKVGVSMCGNHDQAIYHAHWGERWIGPYSEEKYYRQANHHFAKNLRGKLFLIHGDMDDNVHPAATLKLMAALIEANKDFDSLIFPNSAAWRIPISLRHPQKVGLFCHTPVGGTAAKGVCHTAR